LRLQHSGKNEADTAAGSATDWTLGASARLDALIWRKSEIMDIFLPYSARLGRMRISTLTPMAQLHAPIRALRPISSTDTINGRRARLLAPLSALPDGLQRNIAS
jgi:hypothetical protein